MGWLIFTSEKISSPLFVLILVVALALSTAAHAAGGTAKGTVKLQDNTIELKYAYLVKGPDTFEPEKTVSTVILTPSDISGKIEDCGSLSCATGLTEGMTLGKEEFGSTTRVVYWVITNDGMKQYSGNDDLSSLVLGTDTKDKIAGKFSVDNSAIDGPAVTVEFDAPLTKEFKE